MAYAALLLDLDGTLVDSEPCHFAAHYQFLTTVGVPVTQADIESNVGKGDRVFYRSLMTRYGVVGDADAWVERKTDLLLAIYREQGLQLRPGVMDLLERAATRGLYGLVVTSAERRVAAMSLAVTGLAQRLAARVCREDVIHQKPDPEPYLLAAERLSVPPARCLVIEDSPSGVLAGKAAGCTVIGFAGVISGDQLLAAGAERVITHLDQVAL
jgi:HAD superfamily hydrolase (TIGR01509 family)